MQMFRVDTFLFGSKQLTHIIELMLASLVRCEYSDIIEVEKSTHTHCTRT